MYDITIGVKGGTGHPAVFQPVRAVRRYQIGWATVVAEGERWTFPAVVFAKGKGIVTCADWQAPWDRSTIDLGNPDHVRDLLRTGQGRMINPATERDSDIGKHFAEVGRPAAAERPLLGHQRNRVSTHAGSTGDTRNPTTGV